MFSVININFPLIYDLYLKWYVEFLCLIVTLRKSTIYLHKYYTRPEIKLTFLFRVYFRVSADGEDLGQINFELFDEVNLISLLWLKLYYLLIVLLAKQIYCVCRSFCNFFFLWFEVSLSYCPIPATLRQTKTLANSSKLFIAS